jgi:hypothetical protein
VGRAPADPAAGRLTPRPLTDAFTGAVRRAAVFPGWWPDETYKVDLRGADLGVSAGHDSLRGAVIDTGQLIELAPAVAQVLGIIVSDI